MKINLNLVALAAAFILISCNGGAGTKQAEFFDTEHKTVFINGISAIGGKDAILQSLEKYGLVPEKIDNIDLTIVGGEYYEFGHAESNTHDESLADALTYNLFKGITIPDKENIFVQLSWYKNGNVKEYRVRLGKSNADLLPNESNTVNMRLAEMFPHSKIANSRMGYKTYYDDNGNGIYYTDGSVLEVYVNDSKLMK